MDGRVLAALAGRKDSASLVAGSIATLVVGASAYGFAFGLWRAVRQALISAVKMPLLFLCVILASALINTMLAQVLGARVSFRRVLALMLFGMAVCAALMGALAPVAVFLCAQLPPPDPGAVGLAVEHPLAAPAMHTYWAVLLMHTAVVGACGIVGNVRLYQGLRRLTACPVLAARVLAVWIAVSGFVGCELSWLFSPFLCKPTQLPHILPKEYFQENFYERVFRAARDLCVAHGRPVAPTTYRRERR
jgi:hypothetical protein